MANSLLTAALEYQRLGYHPIPCAPREKRPLVSWKDFQTTMPTTEQLTAWWERTPNANVALVLGRGKFAVDLDGGVDAEQLLANEGIVLPVGAPRSKTGGGYHVFLSSYNPVADRVGLLTTNGSKPQVDIRGIGIVVAPPSIHPNGATYQWIEPLVEKPPHAPLALMDLIGRKAEAPASARSERGEKVGDRFWVADALHGVGEGQRDQMCTKLAGFFLHKQIDVETTIAILSNTFAKACTPPFHPADVEKCVRSIARRESIEGGSDRASTAKHIHEVLDELQTAMAAGPVPTLATPFHSLNYFLNGGFSPGELIYLGARPGVGKTALGLELARCAAMKGKGAVIIISREMKNIALARRLVSQDARVPASAIKRGELSYMDRDAFKLSLERLRRLPIWFTDDAVSFTEIKTLVSEIVAETPIALLIVDYLQLIRAPQEIKERRLQVESISQGLKMLAMQFQIPVLCLSSLSRGTAEDRNKRPTLASLRESGELEHDADVILLLHRNYQDADTECNVAKNRDGRLGTARLVFQSDFVAFDEAPNQPN